MASTNTPPEIPPRRHSSTVSPNKIINQNSDAESKTKPPSFLSRRHSSCIDDNMDNETDTICLFLTLIACCSLLISADQGSNYGYGQTEYMNGHPSSSSSFKSNSGSGQPIAARPNTGQAPYAPQNARPALDRNPNGMQADYVPAGSGSSSYQYRNQYKRSIAPQYYSAPAADTQYCSDDAPATPLQATKNIWALAPQETLEYNNYYLHAAPAAPQYYSARPLLAPRFSSAATVVAARPQYHSVQTDAADEPCN